MWTDRQGHIVRQTKKYDLLVKMCRFKRAFRAVEPR